MIEFKSLKETKQADFIGRIFLVTFVIISIFTAMFFLPWQQTVKGEGELIAHDPSQRLHTLNATIDGFVEKIHVRENQYVKKGDILFSMIDLDPQFLDRITKIDKSIGEQISFTKQELEILNKNKENIYKQIINTNELYKRRYEQKKDEISSLELHSIGLKKNYEINKINLERIEKLFSESIESKRNLEAAQNIYIQADVAYKKIYIDIDIKQKDLQIIKNEQERLVLDMQNRIQTIDNQINTALVRLNTLIQSNEVQQSSIARYNTSEVRAKHDGYVVRIHLNDAYRYLSKGQSVIDFAPKVDQRTIVFKVSDFNMPLIKKGLPARIVFYGWPALQISGWPTIQNGTFSGIIERVDPIVHEKGFYYAYVVEDLNNKWPNSDVLRVGTRATVWTRLSTVAVWEQIWRKMNAFPPNMVEPKVQDEL